MLRSLRARLVLGVVLVVAVVGAVAGTLLSRSVAASERDALDERLERTAELSRPTAREAVQEGLPRPDARLDAVLQATRTGLRLQLGGQTLLDTGLRVPGRPRPRVGLRTVTLDGERFRVLGTTLRDEQLGGLAVLEVSSSLRPLERRQERLNHRLALIGLAALLLAGLGATAAAELVLRPLRRLRASAAGIEDAEDLDRRMPSDDGPAEVRSLAASFNAMLARLGRSSADRERALEATRRFAADAGHELRTPLTAVQTTLSALDRHPTMDPARRAALVADALAEQKRFVGLLDGLQALARGEAQELERTPVDLAEACAEAASACAHRHPALRLRSALPDEPVVVEGWAPGLRMVVDNLLENAARHGRADGTVELSLVVDGDGEAVVRVDDDGPGIPPAERERVLEAFARVAGTEHPGSGLGLALVAQQAAHHGGRVVIADAPLGGARVEVRLPRLGVRA